MLLQIIVAVIITLLVDNSAPWWWKVLVESEAVRESRERFGE
jgi:hypothetical protein